MGQVVSLDDIGELPSDAPSGNACLIVSAEPIEDGAVKLINELRAQGKQDGKPEKCSQGVALSGDVVRRKHRGHEQKPQTRERDAGHAEMDLVG